MEQYECKKHFEEWKKISGEDIFYGWEKSTNLIKEIIRCKLCKKQSKLNKQQSKKGYWKHRCSCGKKLGVFYKKRLCRKCIKNENRYKLIWCNYF